MATETLTYYGTGDEAYTLWLRGLELYEELQAFRNYTGNRGLRGALLQWLRREAELSRVDYRQFYGNPDTADADRKAHRIKVEGAKR